MYTSASAGAGLDLTKVRLSLTNSAIVMSGFRKAPGERSHRDIAINNTDVRATGGTGGYAMLRTCEVSAAPVRDA
ncbi:hypothetical protein NFJ02_02g73600 [Pycnococcus provasolii]